MKAGWVQIVKVRQTHLTLKTVKGSFYSSLLRINLLNWNFPLKLFKTVKDTFGVIVSTMIDSLNQTPWNT